MSRTRGGPSFSSARSAAWSRGRSSRAGPSERAGDRVTTYVLRRLLYAVPILLGITLITFLLFHVVGGDPAVTRAGKHPTPEKLKEVQHELGTDRPLPVQYLDFLRQVVTFDLGT